MPDAAALSSPSVVVAFIIGMCVPFRFGMERLRGFGKWGFAKLPQHDPEGEQ